MAYFEIDESKQLFIPGTRDEIVMFSTNCPKCKILESKLQNKGIYYTKNMSLETLKALGFDEVPVLKVGDKYYHFADAVKWINNLEG